MERNEIEAELNEVERDLADIARRAHIAESNLRSVAEADANKYLTQAVNTIRYGVSRLEASANSVKDDLAWVRSKLSPKSAWWKEK